MKCPKCGSENTYQLKSGRCLCRDCNNVFVDKNIDNIKEEIIYPIIIESVNGTLVIEDEKITIIHDKDFKEIPYSEILKYQYVHPKNLLERGFIYFQLVGNTDKITSIQALSDENSFSFPKSRYSNDFLIKINKILSRHIAPPDDIDNLLLELSKTKDKPSKKNSTKNQSDLLVSAFVMIVIVCVAVFNGFYNTVKNPPQPLNDNARKPKSFSNTLEISEETFDGNYPFTVSSGVLKCQNNAIILTTNGRTYAINGTARMRYPDYPEPYSILKDDPRGIAPKMSISDVINQGLKLCK